MKTPGYSARERQIMDVVYRLEKATAREIHEALPDAPTYTSVRSHLRSMCAKGYLCHQQDGVKYIYSPVVPRKKAKLSALQNVLNNFFNGSQEDLIATLIDSNSRTLSDEELEKLSDMIARARNEDR